MSDPAPVARPAARVAGALGVLAVVTGVGGASCRPDGCADGCVEPEVCVAQRCRLPCSAPGGCPSGSACFRDYCETSDPRPDASGGDHSAGDGVTSGCGNGTREPPDEACDGSDLGGLATCDELDYGGTEALGCLPTCGAIDASRCTLAPSACGQGVRQNREQCDGQDLGGATCPSLGFASGTLGCAANCSFDVSACVGP